MKAISFKQNTSQKIYNSYVKRLRRSTKSLPKQDQEDVLMEFNSHIYEGMQRVPQQENEPDHLLNILEKLGEPEEILKPLVAQKKLEQASKTFNPLHVFKALTLNIGNGIFYIFIALLYLSLFAFVFLIYAKIANPDEVGMLFRNGNFIALGKTNPEYREAGNTVEVLGNWFIPVMVLIIVMFYAIITLLLRLKRKIT